MTKEINILIFQRRIIHTHTGAQTHTPLWCFNGLMEHKDAINESTSLYNGAVQQHASATQRLLTAELYWMSPFKPDRGSIFLVLLRSIVCLCRQTICIIYLGSEMVLGCLELAENAHHNFPERLTFMDDLFFSAFYFMLWRYCVNSLVTFRPKTHLVCIRKTSCVALKFLFCFCPHTFLKISSGVTFANIKSLSQTAVTGLVASFCNTNHKCVWKNNTLVIFSVFIDSRSVWNLAGRSFIQCLEVMRQSGADTVSW